MFDYDDKEETSLNSKKIQLYHIIMIKGTWEFRKCEE